MPTCSAHRHPPSSAVPSPVLTRLLRAADEAIRARSAPPPVLLARWSGRSGASLASRDLDPGSHPLDALMGFTAPAHWDALGCLARGTVRTMPPQPGEAPRPAGSRPPIPPGSRVQLGLLLGRGGSWATHTTSLAPEGPDCGPLDTSPPQGHLADACRRALGLPTRGPGVGPLSWWAACWLDRLLAEAALHPYWTPSWSDAIELHPLVDADAGCDDAHGLEPEAFARCVAASPTGRSWDELRLGVAGGATTVDDITADVAGWMDRGMFSRWLLETQLPAERLLADLGALLPSSTIGSVRRALAAWELP